MRAKIKFPHRSKPVEREVHHDANGDYIASKGLNVPVVLTPDGYAISPAWQHLYEKGGKKRVDA